MIPDQPLDGGELYRILAENASDAIITIDERNVVLSVNPAGERLFGYAAEELIGGSLTRLMPVRYRARHGAGMAHYLSTGRRRIPWQAVQVAILTKESLEIPVEISFGEFVSEGRHIFSAIIRDISERMAAEAALATIAEQLQGQAVELEQQVEEAQTVTEQLEQANEELHDTNVALESARAQAEAAADQLRAQEAEYRALANSIPTLAWMAKPDGWLFWYNDRWYEYTGTTPSEMEGWGWQRVHDPRTLPSVLEEWTRSIRTGKPFEMTFPLRRADGQYRPFLTRVFPLRDSANEIVRWFGTNTDVSYEYEARIAAEDATARTRQLQNLTALLARAESLGDIASAVVREAVQVTGAATGILALRDASGDEAIMLDEEGLPAELKSDYARFPLSRDSPTSECLRTNLPIFIRTRDGEGGLLARYPMLRDVWDTVGRSALASVPIRLNGEAVAAMSFTFTEPQSFDESTREFFFALAAQAAQAIARVRAFEAERNERRRSESIVEAITDGFATFDRAMRFTYVNSRAASMFDTSRVDLIGRDINTLPDAASSPFVALIRAVIDEGAPRELEAFGTIMGRWLALRAYPAEDGGAIAYFQDISDRRRRQDASAFLAESSKLLAETHDYEHNLKMLARAAVPRLGDWCAIDLVASPEGQGAFHLRRVTLIHDDAQSVARAKEFGRLFPPDPREDDSGALPRALRGETVVIPGPGDIAFVAGDRGQRHLAFMKGLGIGSMMIVPLALAGRVLGTITFCRGDSNHPYDEVDRQIAEDLAGRAANAVEHSRLLERAEAANAAKAEFLRTVSHELRQPLNAIGGLLQLWELGLRGTLSDAQQQDLERIKRNQLQLTHLIEDLLSFARLEAGRLVVRKEAVLVAPVLEGVASALVVEVDAKKILFQCMAADASLAVLGDADRLHQVLINLAMNAIKATSPGGRIDVTCVDAGRTVVISVRDTGTGIPADKLDEIFTPFMQLGRALNHPRDGVGLGLAISRGLVEAMGGTLTVQSTLGLGSTFTVTLDSLRS